MEIIYHLLGLLAAAIMSVQIAYHAVIAQRVKKIVFFPTKSIIDFIRKQNLIVTIFFIPILVLIKIHSFFKELFDCHICLSFWLGIVVGYILGQTLLLCVLLAPITMLLAHFVMKYFNE